MFKQNVMCNCVYGNTLACSYAFEFWIVYYHCVIVLITCHFIHQISE